MSDARLDTEERAARLAADLLTDIPYCPWQPNSKVDADGNPIGMGPQQLFLLDFGREALYGGAAGGGKSIALMMAASMFLYVPGYSALLLRKSFSELTKPGALMDIADQWWAGKKGAKFDTQENSWYFQCPGGGQSRVVFGYLDKRGDKEKYQGGAYQFIGYDELTHFTEKDYLYVGFSRVRKISDPENPLSKVPVRTRATANPGGPGHDWVNRRFIAPWMSWRAGKAPRPKRNFYPALVSDNPKLDQEDYVASLMELDPITRAQLLRGDWSIRPEGRMFKRQWFKDISILDVPGNCVWVRFWDMASTEEDPEKDSLRGGPDFTAGALVGRHGDGRWFIADMRHWRHDAGTNDRLLSATAGLDTARVAQVMEQEPGSSGKTAIHHYRNGPFLGMNFRGYPSTGSKVVRAGPVASMAEAGRVYVVTDGTWDVNGFLDEIEAFPDPGVHDDRVDAISGAFGILAKMIVGKINLGEHMNDAFVSKNPWRPDVTPHLSPADLAASAGVLGERIEAARLTSDELKARVARAWAV